MQIEVQEVKSDSPIVSHGMYIDIILTKQEISELIEGELLEGHGGIKDKKIFFAIGLQGFYGKK